MRTNAMTSKPVTPATAPTTDATAAAATDRSAGGSGHGADTDAAVEVRLEQVTKDFAGGVRAVDTIDLQVNRGEMVALLGPSGCGKTTTLRILGGLETPTHGTVRLRDTDVTRLPPNRRDTAMVFQSYALFPHLTVAGNVAYGLRRQGRSRAEIRDRVQAMLRRLGIEELAGRRPEALSGGQRQRVAVGRALVTEPSVLLLDEPFSALDAQLREQTRVELRRLQQETGTTAVFVTHDQQEALSISDRVVVMNAGRVEQEGTPQEVYEAPRTRFVAEFLGAANLLTGTVTSRDDHQLRARTDTGPDIEVAVGPDAPPTQTGEQVTVMLRPEDVTVGPDQPHQGRVTFVSYLGTGTELRVELDHGVGLTVRGPRTLAGHPVGADVRVGWRPQALRIVPG
jgi:spermidine/putrescine transport system ATP-binding protein